MLKSQTYARVLEEKSTWLYTRHKTYSIQYTSQTNTCILLHGVGHTHTHTHTHTETLWGWSKSILRRLGIQQTIIRKLLVSQHALNNKCTWTPFISADKHTNLHLCTKSQTITLTLTHKHINTTQTINVLVTHTIKNTLKQTHTSTHISHAPYASGIDFLNVF